MVLGWTSTSNVSEQTQPSGRDKVSGWRLAGPASDFVVRDVCCKWNTQDMTDAPLVRVMVRVRTRIIKLFCIQVEPGEDVRGEDPRGNAIHLSVAA